VPQTIVTDGLRAYSAAMNEIGAADRHKVGPHLNNRAENSHQPFRRREQAMQRFRSMKTLQKFSSVHVQVYNLFNQERHLVTRQVYKQRRMAALAAWRASRRRSPIARGWSARVSTNPSYFDNARKADAAHRSRESVRVCSSRTSSDQGLCLPIRADKTSDRRD
jgi:hypothetical protein